MNYTTNFNLNKPEGTDLYNHLTVDNPNMDTIDAAMQANKLASVGNATELVSGTVHAITRSDNNQNIFKFKATGNFVAGDTVTVDGVTVNAYTTAGQQLPDNAYVLSAEVLCILDGTSLWVFTNKIPDISSVLDWELIGINSTSTPMNVDLTGYKEVKLTMIFNEQALVVGTTIVTPAEWAQDTCNVYFYDGSLKFVRLANAGTKIYSGTAGYSIALYGRK